jgi:hypothetical protein
LGPVTLGLLISNPPLGKAVKGRVAYRQRVQKRPFALGRKGFANICKRARSTTITWDKGVSGGPGQLRASRDVSTSGVAARS